jgi:hypothetical protein
MDIAAESLSATINAFEANKRLADRAVEQVPDDKLHVALGWVVATAAPARKNSRKPSPNPPWNHTPLGVPRAVEPSLRDTPPADRRLLPSLKCP